MNYENILKFRYPWRQYQARVLENSQKHLADGKIHIVAAPGSGKTTLGIELIARMNEPALVLAPSITIREQWAQRIVEGFLCDGLLPEDYISQDLKQPRAITICTYQALHSAICRYKGQLSASDKSDDKNSDDINIASAKETEEVDYSDFDVIKTLQENHVGLMCLDECHHLRSEWWKALEELKKQMGGLKVIALTATPPYDSTPAMWERYQNMCGEIDEEISIPELVKEGSLCPHQDFVYFNYPTAEEESEVHKFKERSRALCDRLMAEETFSSVIQSHKGLSGQISDDVLLEQPNYLASILIFLKEKKIAYPERLRRLLGAKQLPRMSVDWMEELLQGLLYSDTDSYSCDETYLQSLIADLKSDGLIEKRKVTLTTNPSVEKMLTTSKGKAESIKAIVAHEYAATGKDLRLLILTDYIRKEYEKAIGTEEEIHSLGVLPFFEQLRRTVGQTTDLRLGVLCSTIVIIPAQAKEALLQAVGDSGTITFSSVGKLSETDYLKVTTVGDAHFLTAAVTEIFTEGHMQVLIGTKSLLGEGWDAPCINSLILASFVGSFMLSNQMRGRAIRVFRQNPEKTSNIWHLVCLPKEESVKDMAYRSISEDYELLERRMEHFLGLHYQVDVIENGIGRLSIITPPFDAAHVQEMNRQMLALSAQRSTLKERWDRSLAHCRKMDIVEETEVVSDKIPAAVFKENAAIFSGALLALLLLLFTKELFLTLGMKEIWNIAVLADMCYALSKLPKVFFLSNSAKRLSAFGNGIRKALLTRGLLEGAQSKVMVERSGPSRQSVYLSGGTERDKTLFAQCVKELFASIDNQRYLLVKKGALRDENSFYAVPEVFSKKREDAEEFFSCIRPYIGNYELVYTRNEKGRPLLLEGRIKALANKQKQTTSHKKVKNF